MCRTTTHVSRIAVLSVAFALSVASGGSGRQAPPPKVPDSQLADTLGGTQAGSPSPFGTATFSPSSSATPAPARPAPAASDEPTRLELDVLAETNALRHNPAAFAEHLVRLRPYFDGTLLRLPGAVPLRTQEGLAAVDEAITVLRAAKPVPPLIASPGLWRAARAHAADLAHGATTHEGTDGTPFHVRIERFGRYTGSLGENIGFGSATGRDVVMQLVVDDGVPSRGHRTALLSPDWGVVGIGCGPHAQYRVVCVQDFATTFQ